MSTLSVHVNRCVTWQVSELELLSLEFFHVPQSITQEVDILHTHTFVYPSSAGKDTAMQVVWSMEIQCMCMSLLENLRCPHFRGCYVQA